MLRDMVRFAVSGGWLPRCCFLCKASISSGLICRACRHDLVRNTSACRRCAEPLPLSAMSQASLVCASCQKTPPAYESVFAPFLYSYPMDRLIQRFKQEDQLLLSRLLADLMADALQAYMAESDTEWPDCIVPVPTHWRTRLQRGFNPAGVLADQVGRRLGLEVVMSALVKKRYTTPQHSLSRNQRQQNLRHSFQVKKRGCIAGRRIVLLDDVVTTGSTAGVIAGLLSDNGARSVQVWALARTPAKRFSIPAVIAQQPDTD